MQRRRFGVERRRSFSLLLPLVGLLITVPEVVRLIDARRAAEACLDRARAEQISCEPAPDLLFLLAAVVFGLLFAARLAFLVIEYARTSR